MKQPWKKIGLTSQSPRIFCRCEIPKAHQNIGWTLVCLHCNLVVWR